MFPSHDNFSLLIFSIWESLEEIRREEYQGLNTEGIILKVKEFATEYKIPYSRIAVDAIGVGSAVASNSQLDGIIGYKSSFSPIRTEKDIVRVPNMGYLNDGNILTSEYKNLRSQCVFTLASLTTVNTFFAIRKLNSLFNCRAQIPTASARKVTDSSACFLPKP